MKSAQTLLMLASAAAAPASTSKPTAVTVDNEPWYLLLDLGDLTPTEGIESNSNRKILTFGSDKGVMLSVIVQKVHAPATLAGCRDLFDRRKRGEGDLIPANEVQWQQGDTSIQEFEWFFGSGDKTIIHHNTFSCRVRGNYYIDVHASKAGYRPSDHDALMALINDVRIVD
jgi:hypothetical protein